MYIVFYGAQTLHFEHQTCPETPWQSTGLGYGQDPSICKRTRNLGWLHGSRATTPEFHIVNETINISGILMEVKK